MSAPTRQIGGYEYERVGRVDGVECWELTESEAERAREAGHTIDVSCATRSQWDHQRLHRSRRGRYYLEHWSQWQGSRAWAEWIGPQAAAAWLLENDHPMPDDLAEAAEQVSE